MLGALRPDRRLHARRLDDRDPDAPRRELDAKHVRERLERVLRRRVRTEERQRAATSDRAHEDDATARSPKRGKNRLEDCDLPDDVHLELVAQLVERDELERRRDRDAGVVHEPVELVADRFRCRTDLRRVGHVELDGLDAVLAKQGCSGLASERRRGRASPPAPGAPPTRARFPTTHR